MLKGNKIHFTSLGCARNLVDTEVMIGILLRAGFEATPHLREADVLVVNTCGFLEAARQESYLTIEALLKEKKNQARLIVAGCMVQKEGAAIRERFPEIHYLLGSGDMEKILEAVNSPMEGEAVTAARSYLEWGEIPRFVSTPRHFAYLKIAEGCAKRCSFCIIPNIKGPLRSKTGEQVLKEFKILLAQGVKEIILIAQDLGDFGKDRREKGALEALLRSLLAVSGDFWIRLLYVYPDEISDELIALIKADSRLCPYLDMPIQHSENGILKAMRRKTSKEDIIATLEKLRKEIPHIVIRTSLMVGFPGETEEDFKNLVRFVKQQKLNNIGIFKFSLEKEAYAAKLPNPIDESTKESRYAHLASVQMKIQEKINRSFLGKKLKVLIDGPHPDSPLLLQGRFYGQCPEIDGVVILNDTQNLKKLGQFHEVEITDVVGYDLLGRIVKPLMETPKKSLSLYAPRDP
jgi:ribosomal protein S12 methylthiotransferase